MARSSHRRKRGRPSRGWTRTNVRIDRRKLEAARRLLGLSTATETIDAALEAVAFREELLAGVDRIVGVGGLESGFEAD